MNGYALLLIPVFMGCIVICVSIKRYYQNKIETTFQELLQKLDKAIGIY